MSPEGATMSDKQMALEALRQLPESVTLEQISEEIAILAAIRRGVADADAGRVVSHEEVQRRTTSDGARRPPIS